MLKFTIKIGPNEFSVDGDMAVTEALPLIEKFFTIATTDLDAAAMRLRADETKINKAVDTLGAVSSSLDGMAPR